MGLWSASAQTAGSAPASVPPASQAVPAQPATTAKNQQSSTPEDDSITTFKIPVNEVNVVFTVTDKHGRYVKDLQKEEFRVVDDNKPADFKSDGRYRTIEIVALEKKNLRVRSRRGYFAPSR